MRAAKPPSPKTTRARPPAPATARGNRPPPMNIESFLLLLGDVSAKGVVVLLAAALIAQLWRRTSAARKHFVWLAAMVILLFLPMVRLVSPHWRVSLEKPVAISLPQ